MIKPTILMFFIISTSGVDATSALNKELSSVIEKFDFKNHYAYKVVDKAYNDFSRWYFTVIFCNFTLFECMILKNMETYAYGYPVMLLNGCPAANETRVKPKINTHGKTAYIVTSTELSKQVNNYLISALKRTGVWKPRSKVIFVLTTPVVIDSHFEYTLKLHFTLLWDKRITNTILILWNDRMRIYMYNHYLDVVVDVSTESDVNKLLNAQYHDLRGNEIKLSVFRKIYLTDATGPVNCNSELTKTIINYFNATCKAFPPRDGHTVGDLLENGTATGVTADLMDGYTDFELNSRILKTSYYGYIDTTYPLTQDDLCFLIVKAGVSSTFMTAIKLITVNVLSMFAGHILLFVMVTIIVKKYETILKNLHDNRTTGEVLMDLIKCILRQTVNIKFLGPVFRSVTLMVTIYSLIINCAIDGVLTSAITYPRLKPDINTLEQLSRTNLSIAIHNRHMNIFQQSLSPRLLKEFSKRIEIFNDLKIKQTIELKDPKYAILLRKSEANYISRRQRNIANGIPIFHTMQDCPVPCSIVYGLEYGSPYMPNLDNTLHHLNQGGIMKFWEKTKDYTLYQEGNKALLIGDNEERKPLTMETMQGVFYVWFGGLVISTLVFVLEIFYYSLTHIFVV